MLKLGTFSALLRKAWWMTNMSLNGLIFFWNALKQKTTNWIHKPYTWFNVFLIKRTNVRTQYIMLYYIRLYTKYKRNRLTNFRWKGHIHINKNVNSTGTLILYKKLLHQSNFYETTLKFNYYSFVDYLT